MSRRLLALALLAGTALPAAAQDKLGNDVTIYAGYRFGGDLTDVATQDKWEASEAGSFALALGLGVDAWRQYQLFFSRYRGALQPGGFLTPVTQIGLSITYLHFGGTYFFEPTGSGPYVAGGLGLTNFDPSEPGFGSETRFSMSIAAGYQLPLSPRFALRLEGRGYATLVNSGSSFLCSGGCVVQIQGDTFAQGEVLAGLAVRF
ncbi:MAG TPA: outer membrane beta-barrel protein [Burkholderiales bacterium]|nr:outer membrane beta-barrel protein [Burkholderiales bacterium]